MTASLPYVTFAFYLLKLFTFLKFNFTKTHEKKVFRKNIIHLNAILIILYQEIEKRAHGNAFDYGVTLSMGMAVILMVMHEG